MTLSPEDIKISKYVSPSECTSFECEKEGYSAFIQNETEAIQLQSNKTSVTYLFKFKNEVVGYVTLAMGSLRREQLPESDRKQHHYDKIPCLLLGQMARHRGYKGAHVGSIMNDWVLAKASELSQDVGCRLVIVDAENDKADHYQKYFGYQPLPKRKDGSTTTMYFDLK